MSLATVSFRKYFSTENLAGISSHIKGKKLIHRYPKLLTDFSFKRLIGLLAYNEAFSTPPYTGIGLETYFYCNYISEYDNNCIYKV
jgi:hypothetical protein